jgi:hypothetical protein
MPTICARAKQIASNAESEHEDRDDDRSGIHSIPEHATELPHPQHLVNEAADAGTEEKWVKAD